ncbi:MAG: radical SAM protein [Clostridiales bacterium]|jgi:radical SAM protein with 4Fe4S-binding SPASM domain|nr:radical SAM protein [Clostridiales bacterium]
MSIEYRPLTAVWEITMGCNLRCGHCGSSCEERLPDELSTDEALSLAEQIADMGLRWITLSGGEPLLREDLPQIVRKLSSRSVAVNIITNGWLLDFAMAEKLKRSGVSTVALSIDGTEEIHDSIRTKGSFARIMNAIANLKHAGVKVGTVTTVSKINIHTLHGLRDILIEAGVDSWQVQMGQPMGNFKNRPDWIIEPAQVNEIINFCYETSIEGDIRISTADCIGYYSEKEAVIKRSSGTGNHVPMWSGCNAGLRNFGILHNGEILGCTSIRQKSFVEGSIRERSLREIWCDPTGFAWRRNMTKAQLVGDCAVCTYGSRCLGGCPNTRLTMNGDINSENFYCTYNFALKELKKRLCEETDLDWLIAQARHSLENKDFQTAALFTERILTIEPENKKALAIKGFAEFMCGNYSLCKDANEKALKLDPNDTYVMKGLGLALHKLGNSADGLALLEQAAELSDYDADFMNDLTYVRNEISSR